MNAYANCRFAHWQPSVIRKPRDISLNRENKFCCLLKLWFIAKIVFDNPPVGYADTLPCSRRASFTICSACYFIAENMIKQFAYSISQSADADSSLYQREPCYSLGLKCWFAIKQVYQREPCNSFGLKCWFTTEQVQEREPVLLKLWVYRFSINPPVGYADTLPCTGRANLRFIWLAISQRAVDLKFTFLTAEIMLIRSISIISQYFRAVSLYPKWGSRLFVITHIFFLSFP